jgi:hypothetical protein
MTTVTQTNVTTAQDYQDALEKSYLMPAAVDVAQSVINSNLPRSSGLLISKLQDNNADATVLVISDSTGDAVTEWPYLMAVALADLYPAFTVLFRYWDNVGDLDYEAATTIQTGTGDKTLTVYCAAKSGSKPDYFMGARFSKAIATIPQCDLVIFNHGHNIAEDITERLYPINQMLEAIFTVVSYHEGCGVIVSSQNPKRDSDFGQIIYEGLVTVAGICNADLTDSYKIFVELGKPSGYYTDNTHPNATGNSEILLPSIMRMFSSTKHLAAINPLSEKATNYLLNGDFASFSSSVPASWGQTNATCSKNATQFESVNGYSVKLVQTGAGAGSIYQSVAVGHLPKLKNRWVTLVARVYVATGEVETAGRIIIGSNGIGANYPLTIDGQGGFVWKTLSIKVPDTATYLKATIYASSNSDVGEASFDRVGIIAGRLIRDII